MSIELILTCVDCKTEARIAPTPDSWASRQLYSSAENPTHYGTGRNFQDELHRFWAPRGWDANPRSPCRCPACGERHSEELRQKYAAENKAKEEQRKARARKALRNAKDDPAAVYRKLLKGLEFDTWQETRAELEALIEAAEG